MLSVTGYAQRLYGKYASSKKSSVDKSDFTLNRDSTFSYAVSTELRGYAVFYGYWCLKGDTLLLRITKPFDDDSLIKKERIVCKNASLPSGIYRITVVEEDTVPFTLAQLFINDDDTPVALDNHASAIVKRQIKKVRIKYQGIEDRKFVLNSTDCNDFTVLLYDKQFIPSIYLMPIRKWLVRKNGLLPLDEHNQLFKGYLCKKVQ